MNWVFISVVLIILLFAIKGYAKGILHMAYSLVSWALIWAIVSFSTPYINDFLLNRTELYEVIAKSCEEKLKESANSIGVSSEQGTTEVENARLEEAGIHLPLPVIETMISQSYELPAVKADSLYSLAAARLASLAVRGISCLLAWIAAGIIVYFISFLLGIVEKIPILSGVNRYLGVAAGCIYGLLLVWTAFYIVALCAAGDTGTVIVSYIYESEFLKWLYENNPVLQLLMMFL